MKATRAAIHERVVTDVNGCWLWQRGRDRGGYAWGRVAGRNSRLMHRLSYEVFVGPIPEGLTLDHLCRVRHCLNPAHLEPVTKRENTLRGQTFIAANAAKTHCARGHPFDEANTFVRVSPTRIHRCCRTCNREDMRRRRARVVA